MDKLREVPDFLEALPPPHGELKIPVGRMTAFPNVQKDAFCERGIQWLIPVERALFQDDLDLSGKIRCEPSGKTFRQRISGAFPFRSKRLTANETDKLVFMLWPECKIELPKRRGMGKSRFKREVQRLDEAQARLALRLSRGHQIIKGPPGSGKTLVLVHRCCHLSRYHARVKNILLVCYNIALVSYLKRLIQEKGVDLGGSGIFVCHFFELCSLILKEPVHYENEDPEYYDIVVQEALDRVSQGKCIIGPFDAILVDEAQDFNGDMFKTLLHLLRPEGDLVIAFDAYQDIYRRYASWKSLGINASGRTHYLKDVYRNTSDISDFAHCFLGKRPPKEKQLALLPRKSSLHGELPELRCFPSFEAVEAFLAEDILRCIEHEGYNKSEIAIIYDDKVYGSYRQFAYDNRALPMRIIKKMEESGIPTVWVSQYVRAKEMFDITADRVSLISIHSSKGLDFDLVYLLDMERIPAKNDTRRHLAALIYVAMTRAKYRLVIPYVEESEFIKRMKRCLEV